MILEVIQLCVDSLNSSLTQEIRERKRVQYVAQFARTPVGHAQAHATWLFVGRGVLHCWLEIGFAIAFEAHVL